MTKCHLIVEVDPTEAPYRPDEEVRGTVTVEAIEPCHCDWVRVMPQWRTEGKHETDTGMAPHQEFAVGPMKSGTSREFDFCVRLPTVPPAYTGQMLQVRYRVCATASVSASPPPDAFPDITVDDSLPDEVRIDPVNRELMPGSAFDADAPYDLLKIAIPVAGLVCFFGVFMLFSADLESDPLAALILLGPAGLLVSAYVAWRLFRQSRRNAFGCIYVKMTPDADHSGLDCSVEITHDRDVTGVEVGLSVKEVTTYETRRHDRVIDTFTWQPVYDAHTALDIYENKTFRGRLPLAQGEVPHPWSTGKNRVEWSAKITLETSKGQWVEEIEMSAKPVYK